MAMETVLGLDRPLLGTPAAWASQACDSADNSAVLAADTEWEAVIETALAGGVLATPGANEAETISLIYENIMQDIVK
jgi:hypothetical protein